MKQEDQTKKENNYQYLDIKYLSSYEDEDYLMLESVINTVDDNEDNEIHCGNILTYIFDQEWNEDLLDSADSIEGEQYVLMKEFLEKEYKSYGRIALVKSFEIREDLQNKGLGGKAFQKTIQHLEKIYHVDYILLYVKKERKDQLVKFYERFGFKTFAIDEQPMMIFKSKKNLLIT